MSPQPQAEFSSLDSEAAVCRATINTCGCNYDLFTLMREGLLLTMIRVVKHVSVCQEQTKLYEGFVGLSKAMLKR